MHSALYICRIPFGKMFRAFASTFMRDSGF